MRHLTVGCVADVVTGGGKRDVCRLRDEMQARPLEVSAIRWLCAHCHLSSHYCSCQVLLAAWILDAELDETRMEALISGLAAEMQRV